MYRVRDKVYDNRWVTMKDGTVIKFLHSLADVPEEHIRYFKKDPDFVIEAEPERPQRARSTKKV